MLQCHTYTLEARRAYFAGLAFMIIGALMDFVAFGFAAQSLIAPLGSVTLICNA